MPVWKPCSLDSNRHLNATTSPAGMLLLQLAESKVSKRNLGCGVRLSMIRLSRWWVPAVLPYSEIKSYQAARHLPIKRHGSKIFDTGWVMPAQTFRCWAAKSRALVGADSACYWRQTKNQNLPVRVSLIPNLNIASDPAPLLGIGVYLWIFWSINGLKMSF